MKKEEDKKEAMKQLRPVERGLGCRQNGERREKKKRKEAFRRTRMSGSESRGFGSSLWRNENLWNRFGGGCKLELARP